MRCEKCTFALADKNSGQLECRRYPPVVVQTRVGFEFKNPIVLPDGWCGEYRIDELQIKREEDAKSLL